ncbi:MULTISPECIES: hypothetical protein [unclassified Duganella]|uniref:DUF6916 family protein n=1 Tax=unclassified Duganella TaxID=2636909 RepID=UPI000E34A204|nr:MULTISPECIES: hypothetical protein [unclassified Duganella]RFP11301.1 hypothetical protein D0T23_20495 [Duganella sp. BJB475]RFP29620.1 hypothetical protein D0T21_17250 [Duganella sp. BJB476]
MERRTFVIATGGMLGSGGLCGAAELVKAKTAPLAGIGVSQVAAAGSAAYLALVQERFNVYPGGRGIGMTLLSVKRSFPAARGDQFSLTFAVAASQSLASGVYEIEHADIGKQTVYLQLAGNGPEGNYYRADFNLLN